MKYIKTFESLNNKDISNPIYRDIYTRIDIDEFNQYKIDNNWSDDNNIEDILEYFLRDEYAISLDENNIIEFYTLDNNTEELIGDNWILLYHYTSSKLVNSIKENGIINGFHKTNPYKNSYSGVYLTTNTSGKDIDGYKYHATRKHKGESVRISIKMKLNEIEPDMDDTDISSGKHQFISDDISPDRIIKIETIL